MPAAFARLPHRATRTVFGTRKRESGRA